MSQLYRKSLACLALLASMASATAQEAGSSWRLRLMDTEHQTKADATLQFTDEAVRFCMRGKWKRVTVVAEEGGDSAFFPLGPALAYRVEHGVVTMASLARCNPYFLLSASSAAEDIHGSYRVVSTGRSKKLGLFTMNPVLLPGSKAP